MMDQGDKDMQLDDLVEPDQKARVALMGEFSAGKSTLSNLLLGCDPLPVRITATSVPPVWISYGDEGVVLVGQDGSEEHMEVDELTNAALEDIRLVRLTLKSEVLKLFDLLDMPGISDPNLEYSSWSDLVEEADCIVWCTHATQAWRQSEASTWDEIRDRTNGNNLLLVTQFDKLRNEHDRARVLARVRKETGDAFQMVYPISLLDALTAGDDEEVWKVSGADDFIRHLVGIVLDPDTRDSNRMVRPDTPESGPLAKSMPESSFEAGPSVPAEEDFQVSKVQPKRVSHKPGMHPRARPASVRPGVALDTDQTEITAHDD